jgi:cation transport regulator ChaC
VRYFAYGANMDPANMAKRAPGARAIGPARLLDHRLVFRRQRAWRTGVAHVEPHPGDSVWGVLWEIDTDDERALDRYEEVHKGLYGKASVTVEQGDGVPVEAMVYVAIPVREKAPSRRYLRMLVRGARAHGATPEYVKDLAGRRKGSPR